MVLVELLGTCSGKTLQNATMPVCPNLYLSTECETMAGCEISPVQSSRTSSFRARTSTVLVE